MDYIVITLLQLFGICLSALQKVMKLDEKSPDDTLSDVFSLFWKQDKITVIISALVLGLNLLVHFIVDYYNAPVAKMENYHIYAFGIALLMGYAGQRLIYKALGKAEGIVNKRIEDTK